MIFGIFFILYLHVCMYDVCIICVAKSIAPPLLRSHYFVCVCVCVCVSVCVYTFQVNHSSHLVSHSKFFIIIIIITITITIIICVHNMYEG
jgi:hypothetical protein